MAYGPEIPEEVLRRRHQRIQPTKAVEETSTEQPQQDQIESSSDDDDFGPTLASNFKVSEAEALKRLEERSRNKTWENMDPAHNPNRAGWMQNVPAELSGTFSSQSAQDKAQEMMGLKK